MNDREQARAELAEILGMPVPVSESVRDDIDRLLANPARVLRALGTERVGVAIAGHPFGAWVELRTALTEVLAEYDAAMKREPWRLQRGMGYADVQVTIEDANDWRAALGSTNEPQEAQ